jgi:hypothetical protein
MRHSQRTYFTLSQASKPETLEYHQFKLSHEQDDLKKCHPANNDNVRYARKKTVRLFGVEHTDFKNKNVYKIIKKSIY